VQIDALTLSALYIASFVLLLIGYLTVISSKDLIRVLISLELMFGGVFLSLIPLFTSLPNPAFGIALISIFTSSSELLVLIAAIIIFDRKNKSLSTGLVRAGGERT